MTLWYVFTELVAVEGIRRNIVPDGRVISDIRPHHLVFHAGGNDLDQNSCEGITEEMVFRLLSILSSWKGRYNIQTITVLQLTGRRSTYNVPVDKYNFIVCQFNQHLKRELKSHSTII